MTAQTKHHVFLSHNSDDKPFVEDLARRLRKEGLEPWLDKWNLIPGQTYQPAIEEALDLCECCAVFVGPSGVGPWQNEEMRVAIARRIEDKSRKFRVIPVLLPGAERGKRSNLPSFLVATTWVEFRRSLDEPDALHRLQCGIRGIKPGAGPDGALYEGQCPYRGLQFFDVELAPFFHGRESLTDWLLDALSPAKKTPTRFLAILGASGSGKSSLARAGLVARLKKEGLPGSSTWPIAICRPGPNPLESLASALIESEIVKSDQIRATVIRQLVEEMEKTEQSLHRTIPERHAHAVVVVDQFEELFTMCPNDELRQAFLRNLLHAATVSQGRTMVVLTMRADFLGKCAPYAELAAAMSDNQMLVGPMSEDELRIAIERPAQMVGLELEPGLTDMLMREVSEQPGALPLLQHTLLELWERREGRRLTAKAYQEIGGLKGALEKRANKMFDGLGEKEQELCRRIFLRLTQPGEGAEDTKRRAPMEELLTTVVVSADLEKLVQKLANERLVTTEGAGDKIAYLEVSHEALIRHWSKLKGWIEKDRANLRTQRQVTEAAKQWHDNGRTGGYLYSGARLAVAQEWAKANPDEINKQEADFLRSSVRRKQTLQGVAIAAVALLIALTGFSVYEWHDASESARIAKKQEKKAEDARTQAETSEKKERVAKKQAEFQLANSLVSQGNALALTHRWAEAKARYHEAYKIYVNDIGESPFRADLGLLDSYQHSPEPMNSFTGHDGWVLGMTFSPDESQVISAGSDRKVRIWDLKTSREVSQFEIKHDPVKEKPGSVNCVAFSRDGRWALSGSNDKTVKLWDVQTGKEHHKFEGHKDSVTSVAFSLDGRHAISGHWDNTAILWNLETKKQVGTLPGHYEAVWSVAISPDGRRALSASGGLRAEDNIVRVWDLEKRTVLRELKGHWFRVASVAFSPDGRRALSGSLDNTAKLWDLETGKELKSFSCNAGIVSVAFSPKGEPLPVIGASTLGLVASPPFGPFLAASALFPGRSQDHLVFLGDSNGTCHLWDVETGRESRIFVGHAQWVGCLALSNDGRWCLSGSKDKKIQLWAVNPSEVEARVFRGPKDTGRAVAFSPDGRLALSASGATDNAVRLWDIGTGRELRCFLGHTDMVTGVGFHRDGDICVSGSLDGTIKLWNIHTGKELHTFKEQSSVNGVALSLDGRYLLSGSNDTTAKLWDVQTRKDLRPFKAHKGKVTSVAFSSDSTRAISGSYDKSVSLWDVQSAKKIRYHKLESTVLSIAFSRDDQFVLSGGTGLTSGSFLNLWDMTTDTNHSLKGHASPVLAVAFSPTGPWALSGSHDKTFKVWDVKMREEIHSFDQHTTTVRGVAFSPDGTAALSGDGQVFRLWDFNRPARYREFEKMLPQARTALNDDPDNAAALVVLGEWHVFRGNWDWAIEFLNAARAGGADNVSALMLGRCYWEIDDLAQARKEYQSALDRREAPASYIKLCQQKLQGQE